ncbi:MAG: 50S ribosomal protein L7/L12 [Candidatus Delongbacteria bacterium]|nr:50S ribosomal protein L7/L12 [Candidatus Delongbacteria bacterium]
MVSEAIIDQIKKMTVMELADLVKVMEEEFGVSAAAPAAVAVAGAAGGEGAEEEQTEFDVILTSPGQKKIQVIKEVKAITGLGLKEAKDLVDGVPSSIKEAVPKDEAESIKEKIEAAGGIVELK